jgi:hypothetical protein
MIGRLSNPYRFCPADDPLSERSNRGEALEQYGTGDHGGKGRQATAFPVQLAHKGRDIPLHHHHRLAIVALGTVGLG